jgi:hypothetical protein
MRSRLAVVLVSVALLSMLDNEDGGADAAAEKATAWQTDFATARRLARLSGKPIFAVFR